MKESILRSVMADFTDAWGMVDDALRNSWREIGELGMDPARSRQCLVAAITVPLATTMALWLEVDSTWWAAISGYMTIMSTGVASLQRGALYVVGTVAGAITGFIMARWLPYDHFALYLFLAGVTMLGVVAMQVSPHGLTWLFFAVTASLVLLMSLENPQQAVHVAFSRTYEIAIGVVASVIVSNLLLHGHADPPPTPPGWRHLLGAQWPTVLHGMRAAISVVVVINVGTLMDTPQLSLMAITVAGVMSAPVIGNSTLGTRHAVAERSLHLFLGCLLGGIAALLCLALQVESFPWWLAMIGASVWVSMHIQMGQHGVGYIGTQAAFAFIVTLIQGPAPPTSIMPGIDRFVASSGGMAILLIVSLMIWPSESERKAQRES